MDKPSLKTRRLPDWLKVPLAGGKNFRRLQSLVKKYSLHTVCESARCPNIGPCWNSGTLTLMILGDHCTRACRFCNIHTGSTLPPRSSEPWEISIVLSKLSLQYAVITSVDRDDLSDGGANHWARTIKSVKESCPTIKIEALIPDFQGDQALIGKVCKAKPDILAHNLETVASLQKKIRPQCRYHWSLTTLETAYQVYGLHTKSGLMLGLGETKREVIQTMRDLVSVGCKILSLGQYLQPSLKHIAVTEFIQPDLFREYKNIGESLGFEHVESGPLVRSSYLAESQAKAIKF